MEAVARTTAAARPRIAARFQGPALAAWALGFLPVLYLALRGGGYDPVIRNEVGMAVWWLVLVGALVGVLPALRLRRVGWLALGLLAGFAAWTALATGWSDSQERSFAELTRVATYLGVFALALAAQRRGAARHVVAGVASAIGVIALLAVLSRLHPAWFPADHVEEFFPGSRKRLAYPFNSSNTVGPFVAVGLPLAVALAGSARTLIGQALAAAALPTMGLALFLAVSRGGVIAGAVGVAAFLVLAPQRIPRVAAAVLGGLGSALLISAVVQRDALQNGLTSATARSQGDDVLVLLVIVCAGVALIQVALGLASRHVLGPAWVPVSRRSARAVATTLAGALAIAVVAFAASGELSERWDQFKNPLGASKAGQTNVSAHLRSFSGTGRYQYWAAAVEAGREHPLEGTGPGTFEFTWLRSPHFFEYVRNAHSLYFETFAETGAVGLALLLGFVLTVLVAGARRAFLGPGRVWVAAATAGCAAFLAGAATEWTWQVPAAVFAFLVLGAAVVSRGAAERRGRALALRAVLATLAIATLAVLAIHLAATSALRESQTHARAGDTAAALKSVRTAERLQPYAAGPRIQEALLLESAGSRAEAVRAIRQAVADEPANWRIWLLRSRLEAENGDARASAAAFRRAHELFPKGLLTSA